MFIRFRRIGILFATVLAVVLALGACGQKGALFLPRDPAAANRATLPQAVGSTLPGGATSNSPVPALPAPASSVTAPTPEPALPAPYSPLTPPDQIQTFPAR